MEQLLKISGLITDEEAGRSDLGAIERRIAEKNKTQPGRVASPASQQSSHVNDSQNGTPQNRSLSPKEGAATPNTTASEKPQELENLSEMMCSLVTNGSGETRYIGKFWTWSGRTAADSI